MFRPLFKNFLGFLVVFLAIALLFSYYATPREDVKPFTIQDVIAAVNGGTAAELSVRGNELTVLLHDGTKGRAQKEKSESVSELLKNYGVPSEKMSAVKISVEEEGGVKYWMATLLPAILPILLIGLLLWIMARQVQGMNNRAMMFGQSGAREQSQQGKERVVFSDVAGAVEAKEELEEVVSFLKSPKKFTALGAKIPKGVLLMGPPGTGKTLLAKAVAGEANVPFFSISGSEFVEMFVGVGASRVRDLFRRAKKHAPAIVFVDEIDAVGRQRGSGLGGSHDEREQTLNQILVELDGFEPNSGVIVIAATNRPDVLDPALLRPGRFDRRVTLDLPDLKDREQILTVHARNKPFVRDISLRRIAERTPGFSGADLANLLNEAALLAARSNKKQIGMPEILESVEKVLLGPARKTRIISDHEKSVTAYHEAGHAIVAHFSKHADPVHKISIISRGRAGGYTLKLPTEDRRMRTRAEFLADLAVFLGGQVAEEDFFHEISTGPSNDLREATRIARRLVTQYGMSSTLGSRTFGEDEEMIFLGKEIHERRDYSEKTAEAIDKEITKLIAQAKKAAQRIIRQQRSVIEKIVAVLMKKETIERDEFEALVGVKQKATQHTPSATSPRPPKQGLPVTKKDSPPIKLVTTPKPA